MNKILSYLKSYRLESLLGPLFKLLEAGLELLVPIVVAAIIDRGIPSGDAGYIIRMGLILAALGLVGLLSSVTAQYFAAKAAVGVAAKLRRALFRQAQRLSYADLDRIGASTLITRLTSDVNQVQSGINLGLRLLLRSPLIVFGAMLMAFRIDARSALIFAITIPILLLIVFGILLITMPMHRRAQNQLDDVTLRTRENLSGTRVLRALGREDDEIEQFDRSHAKLTRIQTTAGNIGALMNPLTYAAVNLALIALLRTGAVQVDTGALTRGEVVALVNYMGQILVELIKLANLIITLSRASACAGRVSAVLALKPVLTSPAKPTKPAPAETGRVDFEHVCLKYPGSGADHLSNINFSARRGQIIGVIGGTGAGKTTLVNLIPRFYDASSGVVRVDGVDVRKQNLRELRARIGVVPQRAALFAGSIRDNLRWGDPGADDEILQEAVRAAQAEDVLASKGGLDGEIEPFGRNLSGGQRQRLTIARALVRRPEILILDDSASALDFATDARLRMAIRQLPYRPTVFIVSQRAASVRFADRILVLDDGRLVGDGTHEQLLQRCQVYREIFDSQFRGEAGA